MEDSIDGWRASADAWITDQGEHGDWSRRAVLDPAVKSLLPTLDGRSVLDLGCGEGRFSRVMKARGAAVTGIDPIPQFIDRARALDADSTYLEARAEELPLPNDHFDLVLSYLTVVDIPDLEAASREIVRVLKPGGHLIIATISNIASTMPGWVKDDDGQRLYRTVDRYMEHFEMRLEWRGIRICNYHRPLSYVLGQFLQRGCVLDRFEEPVPAPEDEHYAKEMRAPNFQTFRLRLDETPV